ncbi:TKL protein kinase [Phytophthora palmivora]|uniref:TKL protein kinase n=1 Tax=Phytophthora palmivora TaxID=4796 RepID=A0A2P4YKX8_9STRA|nr:TKL protein kinase [Phytophthora palmivora]
MTLNCFLNALQTCLENPNTFLEVGEMTITAGRRQLIVSLVFEVRHQAGSLPPALIRSLTLTGYLTAAERTLPKWFIPPHQVELGRHIVDGACGAVYEGTWVDTDAEVLDAVDRTQFRLEVDLWFSLNHDRLIKLYEAGHEGRAFFVCKRATRETIVFCQRETSSFDLELHSVYAIFTTVASFMVIYKGITFSWVTSMNGALSAYRWKTPECLTGSPPTFASDVYSFGMFIIEALSGMLPWGI